MTSGDNTINLEKEKQKIMNFDSWINTYGSIKQVYTRPSLVQIMTKTSVFFLANEGDAILQESCFFSPADLTADIKQGTLIDCKSIFPFFLHYKYHVFIYSYCLFLFIGWDGNQIIKSTITHGSKVVKDKTVSMCIASTGRRWPDLLQELSYVYTVSWRTVSKTKISFSCLRYFRKVQIAGGLHERCCYFCFDINNKSNFTQLTPVAERQYYSDVYDNLLASDSTSEPLHYSLPQLYFVIKLFGYRIFIWAREAFLFLQPRLQELKTNQPCKLVPNTTVFNTKQQLALRRRSAEHTVRYSCLIQLFLNATTILNAMSRDVIKLSDGTLTEEFEVEAKKIVKIRFKKLFTFPIHILLQIKSLFGASLERSKLFTPNGVPIEPLMVSFEAATSAAALVFNILLPQAVLLFNYENCYENKLHESLVFSDTNNMSKNRRNLLKLKRLLWT